MPGDEEISARVLPDTDSVEGGFLKMNEKKACGVCGKEFSPKHRRQVTCGDADCRRIWENQRKRGRDKKRRERLKKKGIDPNQRRRTECPICGKRCFVGPLDDYCRWV